MSRARFTTASKGAFMLQWNNWFYAAAARNLYAAVAGDAWGFGGMSVSVVGANHRLPFAARILGVELFQRNQAAGAFVNPVDYDLRRALDTVSLATWQHAVGTFIITTPLNIVVAAGETFCVRENDPGQGANKAVAIEVTMWGHRL